ncbi:LuxR C-terminal-related transcriptional regulator [Actinoplanes sp. L3-i22]|uniref:helix-turn-helix transcriptional regulator n=1 Tax=Actinoplanes sp. L3-i22 TaxID=2836373 RepID=UPI001C8450C6|nr:LuxR C-terminal-related transcriptional regulator [Actinoplanes sp. L3-i22]
MQEVERLLRAAAAGRGGALLICGAPGSGRSTLLRSAARHAAGQAIREVPGQVADRAIREVSGHAPDRAGREVPGQVGGWAVRSVPGWAAERELPLAALGRLADCGNFQPGDLVTLGDSLLHSLRTASAHRPLLCLLDDAHLLDAPSLRVIAYAARRVGGDRIAFLAAGPPGLSLFPARHLGPLSPEESRLLLDAHAPDLADDVAIGLIGLCGGNPAALVDLARSLSPAQRRGYAQLPDDLPPGSRLRRRLHAEFAALPPATRRLLLLAAADPPAPLPDLLAAHAATSLPTAHATTPAPPPQDLLATTPSPPIPDPLAAADAATLPFVLPGPLPSADDVPSGLLPASDDGLPGLLPSADDGLPGPLPADDGLGDLLAAEQAGLITVEGDHVRFGSPVARVVAYREMPAIARRTAHLALAGVSAARGRRLDALLHRAAAATSVDLALAAELTDAAAQAAPSGATAAFRYAALLTPDPRARDFALLHAARSAWLAGRPHEATQLLRDTGASACEASESLPGTRETRDDRAHESGAGQAGTSEGGTREDGTRRCGAGEGRAGEDGTRGCGPGEDGAGEGGRRARVRTLVRVRGLAAEMRPDDPASRDILMDVAANLADADPAAALDALSLAGEAAGLPGEQRRFAALARRVAAARRGDEPPAVTMAYHHVAGLAAIAGGDEPAAFGRFRLELALAGDVADPIPLIRAATAGILVGDARRATATAGRAAVLAGAAGAHSLVPRALELAVLAGMATGDYDAATTAALDGVAVARSTGQTALAGTHLGLLAVLAALVGDRADGQARIRAATGTDQARPLCEWALALLDLVDGRSRVAAERLGLVVAGPPGRGSVLLRVAVVPHLLEAAGPEPALNPVAAAFDEWAGRTGQAGWLALRDRCRALRTRDDEAAEAHFHAALRRAGEGGFPRAHTELLYGRLLRRRRRHVAAREHLRRAAETFRLLGAEPWAAQSVRELRAAGERPGERSEPEKAALTAQQERIATLVAEGATNREVAQELHLSTRTVDHHLRNVFARLGVRSRTEMAHLLAAR